MNRLTSNGTNSIQYRPEIDGLRAIAVLSIVLYHVGIGPAAGFVGVDVFFVISGYLITSLLYKEWGVTGHIDLFGFYARRFRRLFPALVLVVIATVVISTFVLSPYGEIRQLTESAAASLLFVSNYYFLVTTGDYFSVGTDTLPLLHLWSLAVEEQFYLIWPILLIIILRRWPRSLGPVLLSLTLMSFLLAELLSMSNQQAAFYQMPARFWELAIGGLIALKPSNQLRDGRVIASVGVVILLGAIILPASNFPGIGALPAVAGAGLLLYAIHGTSQLGIAGMWLRSRPMVFLGLISYSLYLWHWPLLAIEKTSRAGPSPLEIRVLLCGVAIMLAWISYRFVECPFRRADSSTPNRRLVATGLTASFALALGTLTLGTQIDRDPPPTDLASRTSRDMPNNRFSCHYRGDETLSIFPKPVCTSVQDWPVGVVIWGDSMAFAWQPLAWAIGQQDAKAVTSYTRDSCPPILDYSNGKRPSEDMLCQEFNWRVVENISGVDILILSSTWPHAADPQFKTKLMDTIQSVSPYVNRIVLLGPTPHLRDTAPRCIRTANLEACAINRSEFDAKTADSRHLLSSIAENDENITYIEPADFFCSRDICPVLKDGYGLYWDSYHVSSTAAQNYAARYLDKIYN